MLSILLFLFSVMHQTNPTSSIVFNISNIKNDNGYILIALYKDEKGFPDKPALTYKKERVKAVKGKVTVTFTDIPLGKYAAGIIHDENNNQKLDTGFLGIPKEGFCFSNQAMGTVGPPSFEAAAILVSSLLVTQNLKMSYW